MAKKKAKKRGPGRPPKPANERLGKLIGLRLEPELEAFVDRYLEEQRLTEANLTRAGAIRSLLRRAREAHGDGPPAQTKRRR